jgi:hypothetical protein
MTAPTPSADDVPVFAEEGASWLWILGGPLVAAAMIFVQSNAGLGFAPVVPLMFLVLLTSVLAVQVKAARLHTSVELTPRALRQGTETILLSEIVSVYPEPTGKPKRSSSLDQLRRSNEPVEPWQRARTLGELRGIPKGRVAIGLKLTKDRTAQAWARDHEGLRTALTELLESRD